MLATWRRRLPAAVVGLPIVFVVCWVLFFATRYALGRSDRGAWRVPRHAARRDHLCRSDVRGRLRVHADLRLDAHRQHGPWRVVPARRLHRHRPAGADGGQDAQHRTRRRQHCVLGRADARRCRRCRCPRRRHPAGVPSLEPGSGPAAGVDHRGDLGHRGRPVAGQVRWPRPANDLAGGGHPLLRRSSGSATRPAGCSCSASPCSSACCCGCGSTGRAWASSSAPASTTRRWFERWASTSAWSLR